MHSDFLINARWIHHPPGGVRRYAEEISSRLGAETRRIAPARPLAGIPGHLWEQFILPGRIGAGPLWSPANTGPLRVRDQVLTIHDLGPIDHPEWYRPLFARWYRWLWPRLAERVRLVTTPSEFTKTRIVSALAVPESRVRVVPGGVDVDVFSPRPAEEIAHARAVYGLPASYVLYLGDIQPRKNLSGLLAAWRRIQPGFPGLQLAIGGGGGRPFRRETLDAGPGVRFLGRVPDADLPALYSGARLFVQPSYYEGGGLTVLEALACGCPVLAGGNTSLPEYLGDVGQTFEPALDGDLERALRDALDSGEMPRERLVTQAGGFSWEMAAKTIREILADRPVSAQSRK